MSWGCPHEDKGNCLMAGGICKPGKKGCVLRGKVRFIGQEEEEKDAQ